MESQTDKQEKGTDKCTYSEISRRKTVPGDESPAATTTSGPRQSKPKPVNLRLVPGEGRLKELGYTNNVIERLENSRASSSRKHYRSQWN